MKKEFTIDELVTLRSALNFADIYLEEVKCIKGISGDTKKYAEDTQAKINALKSKVLGE